eukprot:Sspe_Gene.23586::Locus_9175_Transcript_1_1_Confidence_1.000_Length_1761::g.23586::m.23586
MTLVMPDPVLSVTIPHDGSPSTSRRGSQPFNIISASQTAAENLEVLSMLRTRLSGPPAQTSIQEYSGSAAREHRPSIANTEPVDIHPPYRPAPPSTVSTDTASDPVLLPPPPPFPTSSGIPASARIVLDETGVGGEVPTSKRWYPRCPSGAPQGIVINYSTQEHADPSKLADEYESAGLVSRPDISPVMSPRHTISPSFSAHHLLMGHSVARRPSQHSILESLLSHAPWKDGRSEEQPRDEPEVVSRQASSMLHPNRIENEASETWTKESAGLTASDAEHIALQLRNNEHVTELNLSWNPDLQDDGVKYIASVLRTHRGLRVLKLVGCCFGDSGALALRNALQEGYCNLVELDVRYNGISKVGGWHLKKSIDHAPHLRRILLVDEVHMKFMVYRNVDEEGLVTDDPIGLVVNQNAMVLRIHENTPAASAVLKEGTYPSALVDELRPGMVIRRVNKTRTRTDDEVAHALHKSSSATVEVKIQSNQVPNVLRKRIKVKLYKNSQESEEEESYEEDEQEHLVS